MSSVSEIEEAILNLPAAEREALESRVLARRYGLDMMSDDARTELLASIDEAEKEIDQGLGVSADQLPQAVRSWAGR